MSNKPAILRSEFVSRMKVLKKYIKRLNKLERAIQHLADENGRPILGGYLIDSYVQMLEKLSGDDSGMISWWIFENDWGKKRLGASLRGKPFPFEILDEIDLWKFIQAS